jgi:hypothetical protein
MNFLEASIPLGLMALAVFGAYLSRRFHHCRPFDPEDEADYLYFQCCECGEVKPGGMLRGGR